MEEDHPGSPGKLKRRSQKMANIDTYLQQILAAIYGEDVRGAIHDAIQEINEVVENWESGLMDTTLTSTTLPAQGKAVGDAVDGLKSLLSVEQEYQRTFSGLLPLMWYKGGLYESSGLEYANPNQRTDFINVSPSGRFIVINPLGKTYNIFEYNSSKSFIKKSGLMSDSFHRLTVSSNAAYIRIMIQSNPSNIADTYGFSVIDQDGGYLVRSSGLVQSGQYTTLASLPLGTVFSINTTQLNEMSDRPIQNGTSGANVLTLAGNNSTRGGSMQMVFYWTGRVYYRGYNSQYQPWCELSIKGKEDGHYPVTLGYFTDNASYETLSSLPSNTLAAFSASAYNGMTDCPYINETGVFVETLSPNYDSENGGIQRITSWNGNFIAVRSYVSNEWREWVITEHIRETVYTVGAPGTGKDFTSLVTCLQALHGKSASKTKKYKVLIDAGTYDVSGLADLIIGGSVNQAGCILPPYTEIIGKGKGKTIISFEYSGSNDTVMSQAAPINIPYAGKISGMSVIVKNIRYAIHTDTDVKNLGDDYVLGNEIEFKDLYLEHKGFDSGLSPSYKAPAAFGMGIWSGQKRRFMDCDFISNNYCGWLVHDRASFTDPALLDFENCTFISSFSGIPQFTAERSGAAFISWGAQAKSIINMRNCYSNRPITLYPNASAPSGIYCDYYGYFDNEIFVMESNNENAHKQDNYITGACIKRIVNGSDVAAYTPVEYNAIYNCSPTFSGLPGRGIALHDAAVGKPCVIQTKGTIYSPWINLHASAVGKSYNWVNGAWSETTDEHPFIKVVEERVAIINP